MFYQVERIRQFKNKNYLFRIITIFGTFNSDFFVIPFPGTVNFVAFFGIPTPGIRCSRIFPWNPILSSPGATSLPFQRLSGIYFAHPEIELLGNNRGNKK
jgi:hypothetical protein